MRRTVFSATALAAALTLAACGADDAAKPAASKHDAHGIAVTLPRGWQRAPRSLTPHLTDPREVVAVGTFPLRYRRTLCAHMPGSALEDLGPRDAFVTLQERGLDRGSSWKGFPRRPKHFGPRLGAASEANGCAPKAHFTDHWFGFTDGGRHFHVLVAFGPKASANTRRQARTILDGLRIDPKVRPDWPSSG
ncbi:MAG: hypothetical protein QOJ46_269 [bacterium]|jgi:hypothetical protein